MAACNDWSDPKDYVKDKKQDAPWDRIPRPGKILIGLVLAGAGAWAVHSEFKAEQARVAHIEGVRQSIDAKLAADPVSDPTHNGFAAMTGMLEFEAITGAKVSESSGISEVSFDGPSWIDTSGIKERPSSSLTRAAVDNVVSAKAELFMRNQLDVASTNMANSLSWALSSPKRALTNEQALEVLDKALPDAATVAADKAQAEVGQQHQPIMALRAIIPTTYGKDDASPQPGSDRF